MRTASSAPERCETRDEGYCDQLHRIQQHKGREGYDDSPETRLEDISNAHVGLKVGEWGTAQGETRDLALRNLIMEGHFEQQIDGHAAKRAGIIYKHLTVKSMGNTATFTKTLPIAILGTFGLDFYRLLCRSLPGISFGRRGATHTLIHDFTGAVRDGEMLLVLGRPGAGCSTFLKTLANSRKHHDEVIGQIKYCGKSTGDPKDVHEGKVNYLPEDDVHLPDLNVWQTLTFALMNKTKKTTKRDILPIIDGVMGMLGISHTKNTKVGNEYVLGVSGGERKRVSIGEILATKSTILCLDNSTRGLDASTALDCVKSLRNIADASKKAIVMTLYQTSEEIYEQMDKVLVIDTGRCIFQGPAQDAKQYFIDLGFYCSPTQTTADFLTSCTHLRERRFRDGYADKAPKTSEELEAAFNESHNYQKVLQEIELYEQQLGVAEAFHLNEQAKSHPTVSRTSPYTVGFLSQISTCLRREFWLLFGDKTALYTKGFVIIAVGLIIGSLFYGESTDSSATFSRGGALFMSILFLCWLQMAELMKAVTGRNVIARHHDYGFYRSSAVTTARVVMDFPVLLPQVSIFTIIMYFMCNLDVDVSKFYIYWLVVYVTTLAMTSLYRMFASLSRTIDDAVRFSGVTLNLLIIYGGYVIPKPQLISQYIWFGWINYVNPLAYAFEAVEANEFADYDIPCNPSQLVPRQVLGAPPIDGAHQGCLLSGSGVDSTSIPGSRYLESTYGYNRSNLWRNLGVLIAFAVLYIFITILVTEVSKLGEHGKETLTFARNKRSKKAMQKMVSPQVDIEDSGDISDTASSRQEQSGIVSKQKALSQISSSQQIFTWENLSYSVPYQGGQKRLLNMIDGYCKPGVMVALMGVSGAGKTTLLNTLSQRQAFGVVSGNMLVDGKPLSTTSRRSTGFCAQMDLHDNTATVREALEFSAILRQDRNIPRADKIAYVETIIDLLELYEYQDTLISCLSLEQRKRLTIGVELAARPSLLLFLDEPTSGLDGQSASSIIRVLRELSTAGQAILCTIHQPSSAIIQQFDMILALSPEGSTVYFGPVGDSGRGVSRYFAERGIECAAPKNIAEFLLETVAKGRRPDGSRIDWDQEWKASDNAKMLKKDIETIKDIPSKVPPTQPEGEEQEFAASVATQILELTKRLFRQYWRDPSYVYGKLFTATIMGIFNGFTFWKLGNNAVDMQNRMFSSFLIVIIPPIIVGVVIPKFFQNMTLWMVREYPSRIYGWSAFTTAQILGEIPTAIFSSVLYWLLWYWPALGTQDHNAEFSTAGYVFLMTMLFFLFMSSWGQWIAAFAPSFTVISNTLPLFFIVFSLFNGVVRPYSSLPVVWKYSVYYINPSQWWISGMLASILHDVPVYCATNEMTRFTPPAGLTCGQYAGAFANAVGGNLTNPDATDVCNYCQLRSGDQYLATLSISPSDKWRNLGIFSAFVVSNYLLVYFFIWSARIKGWGFGMGHIFGLAGNVTDQVFSFFKTLTLKKKP